MLPMVYRRELNKSRLDDLLCYMSTEWFLQNPPEHQAVLREQFLSGLLSTEEFLEAVFMLDQSTPNRDAAEETSDSL